MAVTVTVVGIYTHSIPVIHPRREVETPPQDGKGELDALPPLGERTVEATPLQGKPSAMPRGRRDKASTKRTSHHLRRCHRRASATQKHCHASANSNAPRHPHKGAGTNPGCYHQMASVNMARRRKATQTRLKASIVRERPVYLEGSSFLGSRRA